MVAQTVSFDWIENPMAQSCAMDEDFIGRFCVLTRSVSPRLRVQRAMERYLTQVLLIWMRSKRHEKSVVEGRRMWEGVGFVWLFCSFLVDRLVSSHFFVRFYLLMFFRFFTNYWWKSLGVEISVLLCKYPFCCVNMINFTRFVVILVCPNYCYTTCLAGIYYIYIYMTYVCAWEHFARRLLHGGRKLLTYCLQFTLDLVRPQGMVINPFFGGCQTQIKHLCATIIS